MFIAMNRFRIARGFEAGFETIWRERESRLGQVSGFIEFHLLKGPADKECTLYASHTVWACKSDSVVSVAGHAGLNARGRR